MYSDLRHIRNLFLRTKLQNTALNSAGLYNTVNYAPKLFKILHFYPDSQSQTTSRFKPIQATSYSVNVFFFLLPSAEDALLTGALVCRAEAYEEPSLLILLLLL